MARNRLAEDVMIAPADNGEPKPISPDEAQAAIAADKQRREQAAVDQHNKTCQEFAVDCVCVTQIVNGQVSQGIRFVAR